MVSRITTLERQVVDQETYITELKMQIMAHCTHEEEQDATIEGLELDKSYLEAELEDQCFETNRIAERHLETILDLEESQDKINDLEREYDKLDVRMYDVMAENNVLRSQVARNKTLSDEWLSYKEEVEKIVSESSDALNAQRVMYHELSEHYNELSEQNTDISEREKFMNNRNQTLEETISKLESKVSELEVDAEHYDFHVANLKNTIESLQRRETDLEHEITELTRMFGDIAKGRVSR